ncbi:Armadillo-type fold [Pseudocohnilembus persalinus]|uniref:Armadillo-type fold n=1 Tax=Pseudocohnilembus persalinus TaxID=266149 RepID=A0A0V0QGU0_PSEPJ|nr:Armadillo-type fold [Pseudocohnilembus persalinus]|eukprot:KRX01417.1 Armadillo-type fold [Pseudocohnilembus persalinus]
MDITTIWEKQVQEVTNLAKQPEQLFALYNTKKNGEQNQPQLKDQFILACALVFTSQNVEFELIKQFLLLVKEQKQQDIEDFLDACMIIGYRLEIQKEQTQQKYDQTLYENFKNFITKLSESNVIQSKKIIEFLDQEQSNTTKRYVQQKFSTYLEENEGYPKVIVELMESKNFNSKESAEIIYQNIVYLMGYFDLDPDRVAHLVVEAATQNCNKLGYIYLMKHFKKSSVLQFLGINLENLAQQNKLDIEKAVITKSMEHFLSNFKQNIFILCANLIKQEVFKIEEIWAFLSPSDEFFEKSYKTRLNNAVSIFKDSFFIRTTDYTPDEQKERDQKEVSIMGQYLYNQKLWLMYTLVLVNDWKHFSLIFGTLSSSIDIQSHSMLLDALCNLLNWMIEKVYRPISPSRFFAEIPGKTQNLDQNNFYDPTYPDENQITQCETLDEKFFEKLEIMLNVLKQLVGHSPLVHTKLCRIFKYILKQENYAHIISEEQFEKFKPQIQKICNQYLLPGLQIQQCNPGMVQEFWTLYKMFPYNERYQGYLQLSSTYSYLNPQQFRNLAYIKNKQRPILNKINKENKKIYSRIVGKISHSYPVQVFTDFLIRSTKDGADNLIDLYLNCFNYVTNLSQDIIGFLIWRGILDHPDGYLNTKSRSLQPWFKDYSTFISKYYSRYYQNDFQPVFTYFLEIFQSNNYNYDMKKAIASLYLLKKIILEMTGFEIPEDLTPVMLDSFAGSLTLQIEAFSLTQKVRTAKKQTIPALARFFQQETKNLIEISYMNNGIEKSENISLVYYILIQLSQLRAKFMNAYNFDLSFLADLYDELTSTIMYFIRFLFISSNSLQTYQELIPVSALSTMCLNFKVNFEIAFQICRNSLNPSQYLSFNEEERAQFVQQIKEIFDKLKPENVFIGPDETLVEAYENENQEVDFADLNAYFNNNGDQKQDQQTENNELGDKNGEQKDKNKAEQKEKLDQNEESKQSDSNKENKENEIIETENNQEESKKEKLEKMDMALSWFDNNQHSQIWDHINPELFTTFWMLNLENIFLPESAYKAEIEKLEINIREKQLKREKERDLEKTKDCVFKLKQEFERQKQNKIRFDQKLEQINKTNWVPQEKDKFLQFASVFVSQCIVPRLTIDASEAMYCAKFIIFILGIQGPQKQKRNSILTRIEIFLQLVLPYAKCATGQEASRIAIFTLEILKLFKDWNDVDKFNKTIVNHFNCDLNSNDDIIQHYVIINIFGQVKKIISCLNNNLLEVQNSLQILFKLKDVYPPTQLIAYKTQNQLLEIKQKQFPNIDPQQKEQLIRRIDAYILKITQNNSNTRQTEIKSSIPEFQKASLKEYLEKQKAIQKEKAKQQAINNNNIEEEGQIEESNPTARKHSKGRKVSQSPQQKKEKESKKHLKSRSKERDRGKSHRSESHRKNHHSQSKSTHKKSKERSERKSRSRSREKDQKKSKKRKEEKEKEHEKEKEREGKENKEKEKNREKENKENKESKENKENKDKYREKEQENHQFKEKEKDRERKEKFREKISEKEIQKEKKHEKKSSREKERERSRSRERERDSSNFNQNSYSHKEREREREGKNEDSRKERYSSTHSSSNLKERPTNKDLKERDRDRDRNDKDKYHSQSTNREKDRQREKEKDRDREREKEKYKEKEKDRQKSKEQFDIILPKATSVKDKKEGHREEKEKKEKEGSDKQEKLEKSDKKDIDIQNLGKLRNAHKDKKMEIPKDKKRESSSKDHISKEETTRKEEKYKQNNHEKEKEREKDREREGHREKIEKSDKDRKKDKERKEKERDRERDRDRDREGHTSNNIKDNNNNNNNNNGTNKNNNNKERERHHKEKERERDRSRSGERIGHQKIYSHGYAPINNDKYKNKYLNRD